MSITQKSSKEGLKSILRASDTSLVRITVDGVQSYVLVELAGKLGKSTVSVGTLVGISRASLDRRLKSHARLGLVESDRIVRFTQLWKKALHLWRGEDAAREWLTSPSPALAGETPIDHAITEVGSRQVEDLMGQIAYGIAT